MTNLTRTVIDFLEHCRDRHREMAVLLRAQAEYEEEMAQQCSDEIKKLRAPCAEITMLQSSARPAPASDSRTLSPSTAAARYGIAERTLQLWCQKVPELGAVKRGTTWHVEISALEAFLRSRNLLDSADQPAPMSKGLSSG